MIRVDRSGFALAAAVAALVLVGALAVAGHLVSVQAYRLGRAALDGAGALYTAESGLAQTLARWPDDDARRLEPGAEAALGERRLPSGDAVQVRLQRIDDGAAPLLQRYLIHARGRAGGRPAGARHLALAVELRWPARICCRAALTSLGETSIVGAGAVSADPAAPSCALPVISAGLARHPDSPVALAPGPEAVAGDPPILTDPSLTEEVWNDLGGGLAYSRIARLDDRALPAGARLEGIGPRLDPGGACDTAHPLNWGAPADPTHPCAGHFRVIHAAGDLTLLGPGEGQGVLLVDGDLRVEGGFRFYGSILVRGAALLRGTGTRLEGSLVAARARIEAGPDGAPALRYDPCRARAALVGGRVAGPRALRDRPWVELMR